MRSLHASMGAKEMPAEPVFEELPSDLSDASIVFGSLTEKLASTINTGDMTVGTTGSVPTYTSPSTAITAFSIVSVPPDPPTIPGFSAYFNCYSYLCGTINSWGSDRYNWNYEYWRL